MVKQMNKVFVHLVDFYNTRHIAEQIVDRLLSSSLVDNAEITINCNYRKGTYHWLQEKVKGINTINLVYQNNEPQDAEFPTINMLKDACDSSDEEFNVLYLHHKGATQPFTIPVTHWRELMLYYNVDNWQNCVEKLNEGYDTVGVNWRLDFPREHYSGNFWWARSSYIKKLDKLKMPKEVNYVPQYLTEFGDQKYMYQHDAEFWIGSKQPKFYSFHNSNINHYIERYPEEKYKT
jgi:hypothetical protein